MGADQDVNLPGRQALADFLYLFFRPQAAYVIDRARQVFQPRGKGGKMLQGEDGRGNQYRHLFSVRCSLERSPDGDFRLSETHVAANEAVHGAVVFHVMLHRLGGRFLVRRIFVHKGRFQFFLEIAVRREGKALGSLAFGIQLDQVLGNVLDLGLCAGFQGLPGLGTQFVDARRLPFLAAKPRNLVQGMHRNKDHIAVFVHQFHHLVHAPFVIAHPHEPAKDPHAMVDMNHVIANIEGA